MVTEISNDLQDPSSVAESDPFYAAQFSIGNTVLREGEPVGLIYGYQYLGVIQTEEQLAEYKANSVYAGYGLLENVGLGYPMYGVYEEGTYKGYFKRDVIGSAQPNFYGGITNSISYKNVGLIALLTFSQGGDLLYMPEVKTLGLGSRGNLNTRALLPRYSAENPTAELPTLYIRESGTYGTGPSSLQVHDASYIKLKSISINYSLPQVWMRSLGLSNGLIYVSGSNLLTLTNYPGPDPETSNDPYSLIGGYTDAATYPSMKQYTFGLRFGF